MAKTSPCLLEVKGSLSLLVSIYCLLFAITGGALRPWCQPVSGRHCGCKLVSRIFVWVRVVFWSHRYYWGESFRASSMKQSPLTLWYYTASTIVSCQQYCQQTGDLWAKKAIEKTLLVSASAKFNCLFLHFLWIFLCTHIDLHFCNYCLVWFCTVEGQQHEICLCINLLLTFIVQRPFQSSIIAANLAAGRWCEWKLRSDQFPRVEK